MDFFGRIFWDIAAGNNLLFGFAILRSQTAGETMTQHRPPPPRTTIFTPVKTMPKNIKDAATNLGAPDATAEDIEHAVETLRSDGQVRGGGANIADVRGSAVELVREVYRGHSEPTQSPDAAALLAFYRLYLCLPGGTPGSTPPRPGEARRRRPLTR